MLEGHWQVIEPLADLGRHAVGDDVSSAVASAPEAEIAAGEVPAVQAKYGTSVVRFAIWRFWVCAPILSSRP